MGGSAASSTSPNTTTFSIRAGGSALNNNTSAAITRSAALRASSPMQSRKGAKGTAPATLTAPQLGFQPVTPQQWAGIRIDPPVSEPSAITPAPLATATAEPDEDPPGTKSQFQGLRG